MGAKESFRVLSEWTERHNEAITSGDVRIWRDAVTGALEGKFTLGTGPSYALRTEDGGSLVWYGLKQEMPLTGGDVSTLPAELRDHLAEKGDEPSGTLRTTWQWLVIGYAPPSGKGRVLGESVSLVSAR
ncbi:hypothetical protein LUW76_17790 [Actinomadura madurae]|uniref:hypothetical protein n=1 Tax=Actinomadura madurae TaxID=1993 RepID=UPI002025ECEC|nr:hypothetical protein [Actinomadura madurae]URM96030.1 hypothetical protein LUW76_17790 [Actinomadura madurae]